MRPMRPQLELQQHRGGEMGGLVFTAVAILFWVAVIFGLIMLVSWYAKRQNIAHGQALQDPIDIAKARYAKGEITKDEFEQLKKDLK